MSQGHDKSKISVILDFYLNGLSMAQAIRSLKSL